jgi:D-lactate dehydrogenase (cytochrome)
MDIKEHGKEIQGRYEEYLRDESRLIGQGESISFPKSDIEVKELTSAYWGKGIPITVQGARTGVSGSAVPCGGHVLSMEKMNTILGLTDFADGFALEVEPGVRLAQITEALSTGIFLTDNWTDKKKATLERLKRAERQVFPPDPTETNATIGGMFACNAQGTNGYRYGNTGSHVRELNVLLVNGEHWSLTRGQYVFDKYGCPLPGGLRLETGTLNNGPFPYRSSLGAYEGMDLVDLFAGSEGMLGIVTRLVLQLRQEALERWGVLFFFDRLENALKFVRQTLELEKKKPGANVSAIELFHQSSLRLIQNYKRRVTRLQEIPDLPLDAQGAIYIEMEGDSPQLLEEALMALLEAFTQCGGRDDDTWAATGSGELEKFKLLRHAAPESVNAHIDEIRLKQPTVTKLSTDFSAPMDCLEDTLAMYIKGLDQSNLEGAIFGHVGCNHIHVNLLPQNPEEDERGKKLIFTWAEQILALGGNIITEKGVGKTKRSLFLALSTPRQLEIARTIKNYFDPKGLLNPGNMF